MYNCGQVEITIVDILVQNMEKWEVKLSHWSTGLLQSSLKA
jgi:hypothetical protein